MATTLPFLVPTLTWQPVPQNLQGALSQWMPSAVVLPGNVAALPVFVCAAAVAAAMAVSLRKLRLSIEFMIFWWLDLNYFFSCF